MGCDYLFRRFFERKGCPAPVKTKAKDQALIARKTPTLDKKRVQAK
jgi:hypothetical protein